MRRLAVLCGALCALAGPAGAGTTMADSRSWSLAALPSAGVARVLGAAYGGCIAGARALPLDGPGYAVVRVSRNRFYGHPTLIAFVQGLGRAAQAAGFGTLYIGDLAQPRGGPMAFGHGSHQSGLDADVWFNLDPKPPLPAAAREDIDSPSLVTRAETAVDRARWRPAHAEILRLAARAPAVDRIFVHWAIKRELCDATTGDRAWLRKIRPWYGHREHFHVRLSCPADSPVCVDQKPIPPGDGCDSGLDWWFSQTTPPPRPIEPRIVKVPEQCQAVLRSPAPTTATTARR